MTLKDVLPIEFLNGEYDDTEAYSLKDIVVKNVYSCNRNEFDYRPWCGPQKNVNLWVRLENGKIVGFNQNMSRGWSFPVLNSDWS